MTEGWPRAQYARDLTRIMQQAPNYTVIVETRDATYEDLEVEIDESLRLVRIKARRS